MVDQLTTFFNEVYDRTYDTVARYVISKCSNTDDIADIIQETYTELYAVLRPLPWVWPNAGFTSITLFWRR